MSHSTAHVTNKSVINFELEKKKELERRKILRLLQVRQQSKDFAGKLREHIKEETTNQKNKIFEMKKKQIQEKQLEELNRLKDIYEMCLKSVGEGHREASKQPNITSKAIENETQRATKAASRGAEARKQQLKNEALHQQQNEAPIKQKRKTRNKENLRSFYVSSLPKHSQLPVDSLKPLKASNESSAPAVVPQILQEVPSNLVASQPTSTRSFVSEEKSENETLARRNLNVDSHSQKKTNVTEKVLTNLNQEDNCSSSPKECCCDYVVCSCHNSPPVFFRRRCQSVTRLSSEGSLELGINHPLRTKTRSRSCSPRSVRALNYRYVGNLFESNQRNFVTVTHHSSPPKSKEDLATFIDFKKKDCNTKSNCSKEIKEKIEERGKKALKREHLKKDFQQLLHDLGNLTRRKQILKSRIKTKARIYQRERDVLARNVNKQKKLADAFETLLHTEKSKQSQISGSLHETTSKTTNDSPPPTLNLALCQQVDMPQLPVIPENNCVETERLPHRTSHKPRSRETGSRSPSPTHSTDQSYHVNSLVSVRTEPSGNIHVIVKPPTKGTKHKKKCKKSESLSTDSSTSSYCDPPNQLTASELELIENLKKMFKKPDVKKDLRKYIEKLLTMRRESIDCLDVQGSPASQPLNAKQKIENSLAEVSDLSDHLANKLDELAEIYKQCKRQTQPSPPSSDQYRQLPSPECPRSSRKLSRCSKICPSEKTYSPTPTSKPNTKRRVLPCPKTSSSSRPCENFESETQPENPGGFQTPFGLSSNLLPRTSEQTPAFTCPRGEDRHVAFERPDLGAGCIKSSEKHPKCRIHSKPFTSVCLPRSGSRHRISNPERSLSHEQKVPDPYSTSAQQRLAQDHSTPQTQQQINDSINKDSLIGLRKKLSQMCTEDYSHIIEMLFEDTDEHKLNLLNRAKSNPLLEESSDNNSPSPTVPGNRSCGRPQTSPQMSSMAPSPLSTDKINNIQSISILSKNRQK